MTTTTLAAEEAVPMPKTDLEALAHEREARWRRRKAALDADKNLDPRIRRWYADRELWDIPRCNVELDMTKQRVSMMRTSRRKPTRRYPHPSVFPPMDAVLGVRGYREIPGTEGGRVREWAVRRGSHVIDPDTGALTKVESFGRFHGRARADPNSRSKLFRPAPKTKTAAVAKKAAKPKKPPTAAA